MMWLIILLIITAVTLVCIGYMIDRVGRFGFIRKMTNDRKRLRVVVSATVLAFAVGIIWVTMSAVNAVICFLHLTMFWIVCDVIGWAVRRIRRKKRNLYVEGIIAILITIVYLCGGWYAAHNVVKTEYNIETDKKIGSEGLRIVQITDSHIGALFNWQKFEEYIEEINSVEPDVVFITGDFVDDRTTLEDMTKSCEALSGLSPKYGVYFVYGNHDKGYSSASARGYGENELAVRLEENGVGILEDESVWITENVCVVGRQDSSVENRAKMDKLIEDANTDKDDYIIVLDHQPGDYDAQADSGVDLVLSGHTHGGQLLPITFVGEWIGVNDATYGYERRKDTDFIVSSGIGDWEIKFKTACISEYVVIDVE